MAAPSTQLASAARYVLLAYSGITNTGSTVITGGNIGSFPTNSITGFPPGVVVPPYGIDSQHAQQAEIDALAAYNFYAALAFTSLGASSVNLSTSGNGSNNHTYIPGNYSAGTSMDIPTNITLDAQGNPNALFVFKAGSTLTLESGANVLLANGAQASNVVWLVGSSYTSIFAGASVMNGVIIAQNSITLGGGVLNGVALAGVGNSSGAVTIASAMTITSPLGATPTAPGTPGGPTLQCLISRNQGQSVPTAWPQVNTSQNMDLIQIVDNNGEQILLNVDFAGVVHFPALNPTTTAGGVGQVRIGQYVTRLALTNTLAQIMQDAFKNWDNEDIIQVQNIGGAISYWWDYLGVAHGA